MSTDRAKELQAAIDSADYERFATLEQAASDELMRLWGDLHHAMRDARGGCWSVGCESVAHRVAVLTRALGKAAHWQDMDIELLETGVYQRMHDLMGVPYEQPDMDVIAKMRANREASLAEIRKRPLERCSTCIRHAARWAEGSISIPPPDGCSDCAELNGLPGGLLGAMRYAKKNSQVARMRPAQT